MSIVALHHVRKVYDTKVAVDDMSFTIGPGMMFGLLGPNGSGKTSTIRMMIGITVPDSGTVELFGAPFDRRALSRVGYLPEERGLYKKMKVVDQLVFLGQMHGLDAATASRRAHAWCERLQILESVQKRTEDLSKGMQQKIQFISTLLHEPELIIMDEPFSGLDPVNASLLQDTLEELRNQGRSILFSTHRMDQVERMCDQICLIHNSKLVLSGSMRDIKSRYPVNRVQVVFQGDDAFLAHAAVASVKRHNEHAEIVLRPSADNAGDAQQLLAFALAHGTRILRFELTEPTLEEIFIETVGTDHADFDTQSRMHRVVDGAAHA
ncbi:MAG: ATP-binding cassette domain-containing protein [Acidobacteriota bacterium]|nr:ATP-binding cassette domain-containing protein [Acidobacteriota bacterium]